MPVVVAPDTFTYVSFDAALIRRVAATLVEACGLAERTVTIEVDETSPVARTVATIDDSGDIHVSAASGAFEDTRKPREQSETATATALGRALLRIHDRLQGGFADAPPDDQLTLAQLAAWETSCIGRLERMGVDVNRRRWQYNFRNRHGFSDRADLAFDALWRGEPLTWIELCTISDSAAETAAAQGSVAAEGAGER